jgi:hypothetical protein
MLRRQGVQCGAEGISGVKDYDSRKGKLKVMRDSELSSYGER